MVGQPSKVLVDIFIVKWIDVSTFLISFSHTTLTRFFPSTYLGISVTRLCRLAYLSPFSDFLKSMVIKSLAKIAQNHFSCQIITFSIKSALAIFEKLGYFFPNQLFTLLRIRFLLLLVCNTSNMQHLIRVTLHQLQQQQQRCHYQHFLIFLPLPVPCLSATQHLTSAGEIVYWGYMNFCSTTKSQVSLTAPNHDHFA